MLVDSNRSTRQTGEFGYTWMLFCLLICCAFLGFLGATVSQGASISDSAVCTGAANHGWHTTSRDRSGEVEYEGLCFVDSADYSILVSENRPANDLFAEPAIPVAPQLPGELNANYFRPPPTL